MLVPSRHSTTCFSSVVWGLQGGWKQSKDWYIKEDSSTATHSLHILQATSGARTNSLHNRFRLFENEVNHLDCSLHSNGDAAANAGSHGLILNSH